MYRALFHGVAALTVALLCNLSAWGQPVPSRAPNSTHIYPAGGQRGQSLAVRVGAECLPPGAKLAVIGKGVRGLPRLDKRLAFIGEPSPRRPPTEVPISYPKEWASQLEISADAPLGAVFWRLSSGQGGTACRPFIVGHLPEHVERESNSTLELAERVQLPVTINGQICGERDMDYFRFHVERGSTVVVDVSAQRLESRFDPIVEIRDARGQRPPLTTCYSGGDPILAFQVARTGDYVLRLANVSVHGSPAHVYRVTVTTKPYVRFGWPAGGTAGHTREMEFVALATGERLRRSVAFPDEPGPFVHHDDSLAAPVQLYAELGSSRREQEPNDSQSAESCRLGESIYGSLESSDDEDWFRIRVERGENLAIQCHAFPAGSEALPTICLCEEDGNRILTSQSLESTDGVCRVDWTAPKTSTYLVQVRDIRFGARGGVDFLYRLRIARGRPDFALTLDADVVNVVQGQQTDVTIKARRSGGFSDEIHLEVDGLPDHVGVDPGKIAAGKTTGKLSFKPGDQAVSKSSPLRIVGVAQIAGQTVRRAALQASSPHDDGSLFRGQMSPFISVAHKPVFRLYCSEAYLYAHRGSIFPYPMEIERLNGFSGDIELQIGDRQNRDLDGIEMLPITVPAGQTLFHMPIYLPESMHINIQSQSQLYTQAYARFQDEQGNPQSVLVVSEKRNMLRTRPPVVKLTAAQSSVLASPGSRAAIRLRLKRTSNFPGAMRIRLLRTSHSGVSAEPAEIQAGRRDGVVWVTTPRKWTGEEVIRLTFRGEGELDDRIRVVSETNVNLRCAAPG